MEMELTQNLAHPISVFRRGSCFSFCRIGFAAAAAAAAVVVLTRKFVFALGRICRVEIRKSMANPFLALISTPLAPRNPCLSTPSCPSCPFSTPEAPDFHHLHTPAPEPLIFTHPLPAPWNYHRCAPCTRAFPYPYPCSRISTTPCIAPLNTLLTLSLLCRAPYL